MNKKLISTITLISLLATATIPIGLYLNFKSSPKYTIYQLYVASQNGDSELAMQYFDVEKIVDTYYNENIAKDISEDNPYAALGIALAQSLKPAIVEKVRHDLTESFKTSPDEKIEKENILKLMLLAFTNKALNDDVKSQTYKKIDKKKYILTQCFKENDKCTNETLEKIDDKWVITSMDFDNN